MRNLKRALSLTLASVMLLGMMVIGSSAAQGYPDVDENDNVEAIEVLQAIAVMVGDAETGNFRPDAPVSRAEMAVVMGLLLDLDYNYYVSTCPFADVSGNYEWARGWVGACAANGIIAGRSATSYDPGASVTAIEAASMMMRALGYFKNAEDYADGFQVVTVRQGSSIGIFNGIGSDATTPMTRNQVAQLALNALRSNMVDFTGNLGVEVNGVKVNYRAEYTPRTSPESKYNAIANLATTILTDNGQYYIQLGEQLYDGKLRLNDNAVDEFGRPSRYWEYDGKAIGTYAKYEIMREEYTTAITGKDLYDLLGSDTIRNYSFDITIDGVAIDGKTGTTNNNTVLTDYANSYFDETYMANTYKSTIGKTGNGVLTQVFVDVNKKHVDVAVINTYLAQATNDYSEKRDEVSLKVFGLDSTGTGADTVYYKYVDACKHPGEDAERLTISSEDFASATSMKKDDIVLVTQSNGVIMTMAEPEVISETSLDAFSLNNYVVSGSTQYDYNTTIDYDPNVLADYTGSSVTNLKDTLYNLYLDPYGYLIGVDVVEAVRNYIFLTGIDQGSSNLNIKTSEAAGILLDGTFINFQMNMTDSLKADGTTKFEGHGLWNTWCTYTVDKDGTYTLKEVGAFSDIAGGAKAGQYHDLESNNTTIDTKRTSLLGDVGKYVYGNDDSVYILAELKEVSAKNSVAKGFSVPGDGSAGATASAVAINGDIVIISGVESYGVGIDNVSLKTFDNASDIPAKVSSSSVAYPGWIYTLFDEDYYVIGAVVVGEDVGTTKNLVYVNSGSVNREDYNRAEDEYTWGREVIFNGEKTNLTEIGSGLSKLKSMTQNTWYEVTYKADGSVKDVTHAYFTESEKKVGKTPADSHALTLSNNGNANPGDFVNHIEFLVNATVNSGKSTVLYEEVWGKTTTRNQANDADVENKNGNVGTGYGDGSAKANMDTKPSLKGSELFVDTDAQMGFYVHKDVKSVLIQKNNGQSTTSYGEGTSDLEGFLEDLNFANDTYLFKISAILVDGRATVVVIHDWNETNATGNDKDRDPGDDDGDEDEINVYVSYRTTADDASTQIGEEVTLKMTRAADGRLTLTKAQAEAKLPAGYELDDTAFPKSLTVAAGTSYAEVAVKVKQAIRTLKLPEGYSYEWAADDSGDELWEIQSKTSVDASAASAGISVPVGATVTVTVGGTGADKFYIKNPVAKATDGDNVKYLTADDTFDVDVTSATTNSDLDFSSLNATANKYYHVTATEKTADTAIDGVTYTVAAVDAYLKVNETVDAAVTGAGTSDGSNTGGTISVTLTNNAAASLTGSSITSPANGASYAGSTLTIKLTTAPDEKDTAITFSIS